MYSRKADSQVLTVHPRLRLVLHDAMKVQHQSSQSRIVWIWQIVDALVNSISTLHLIIHLCRFDEVSVSSACEQRVWQLLEECLQQASHCVHVVKEVRRVAEVQLRAVRRQSIKGFSQTVDV